MRSPLARRSLALLLLLLLLLLWAAPPPALAQTPAALAAVTDSIFRDVAGAASSPGCAVGVSRDDSVVLETGRGLASLEYGLPITAATRFNAASVSKQFTAMAVALLAEDGRLSWDDEVGRYLTDLPAVARHVTLRQLAGHVSGLRDFGDLFASAGGRDADVVTEDDVMRVLRRQRALNFAPGTQYLYTNVEFVLLARVVRQVSGLPLARFAAERIFRPLGMTHTGFVTSHAAVVGGRAFAYERDSAGWALALPGDDVYGSTGLFTTVGDLLRWERNFDRPRVGAGGTLDALQRPGRLADGTPTGYGLGLTLASYDGRPTVGHNGASGGYRSDVVRFPNERVAVAVLCNGGTFDASAISRRLAATLLPPRAATAVAPSSEPVGLDAPAWPASPPLASLAGLYRNPLTNDIRRVVVRDGDLLYARGAGSRLVPLAPGRFRFAQSAVRVDFFPPLRGSRPQRMRVAAEGQPATTYELAPPYAPGPAALREYAGRYYSDELDVDYRVSAGDSTLTLSALRLGDLVLRPAFAGAFHDADFLVRFTRDRAGRVDGLLLNNVRVRDVRFVRHPPVAPPSP